MSKIAEFKPKSEYYQACLEVGKGRYENYCALMEAGFTQEEAFMLVQIDAQNEGIEETEDYIEFTAEEQD